jgi:hypothetical protein
VAQIPCGRSPDCQKKMSIDLISTLSIFEVFPHEVRLPRVLKKR